MKYRVGRFSSVRVRLTLGNTLTFAFVLVTLGTAFRFLAQNYLLGALDHEIKKRAQAFQTNQHIEVVFVAEAATKGDRVSVSLPPTSALRLAAHNFPLDPKSVPNGVQDIIRSSIRERGSYAVKNTTQQIFVPDSSGQFLSCSFDLQGKPLPFLPANLPIAVPGLNEALLNVMNKGVKGTQEKQPSEETRPWDKKGFAAATHGREQLADVDWRGTPLRVFSLPLRGEKVEHINFAGGVKETVSQNATGEIIGVVQIAAPLGQVHRDIAGLTHLLLLTLPPALLVAACAGIFLTGRMLRPVKALTLAATNLRADQLAQRLPVRGTDEFAELAATFNRVLDRVEVAFGERERAMEQLRRFTADASHELRTPLTTIKANTGVALKETQPSDEHLHALRQIDHAADRMTALIRDLLLLARADAGQTSPELRPLLVEALVQNAIEALSHAHYAPIVVEAREPGLVVLGEAEPLCRLFLNLLENAVRYTPLEGQIRITLLRQEQQVCLRVQDTGCGIAPAHLPHLGERFYRADSGRDRKQGGTGLGLAICRSIVARHQGTFAIESEIRQGTTVTICLPRAFDETFRNLSDLPATL